MPWHGTGHGGAMHVIWHGHLFVGSPLTHCQASRLGELLVESGIMSITT